jgi:hypothetical protein
MFSGRGKKVQVGIPQRIQCLVPSCTTTFRSRGGLTNHVNTFHQDTHQVSHHHGDQTPPSSPSPAMDLDPPQSLSHADPLDSNLPPNAGPSNIGTKIYHPLLNGNALSILFYAALTIRQLVVQDNLAMRMEISSLLAHFLLLM